MTGGHHGGFAGHGTGRNQADEEVFGTVYDQRVIQRILQYVSPFKKLAFVAVAAMLIYTGTQVAVPWTVAYAIDNFIVTGDFSGLTWVFVMFLGIAVLNWVTNYVQQLSMEIIGQKILYRLRKDLFAHVQSQSLSFFDKTEVGRLMSRIQGDVGQLQEFSAITVMTLGELLSLVGIVTALLILSIKLGLITMVVLPILIVVMVVWQPFARQAFLEVRNRIAIVNAAFNENITGVRVVQSMNRQDRNLEVFDTKNLSHRTANLAASRLSAGLLPGVDILTAVAIGVVLFFGAEMVRDNQLEIGVLVAFILYIQRFFDPIRNLTMQYTQLQRSMASGARIFDLMDRKPEMSDTKDAKRMPIVQGDIKFQNVSFNYIPGEDVLRGLNLHIEAGETVAVVGPTGAGKTSLVGLLSRFYEVSRDRGTILIDGLDVRDVKRESLVSQMSMVLQEPFLFSGTIRDNIKYNHGDCSDELMISATKSIGAHNFIEGLSSGYDTFLRERGSNLSIGQRQLISFARAIIADPRILILDEATANIDSHTEVIIQRALKHLFDGRTAIVIAHRLSTIRGADRIVVLHDGRIVETGDHTQLMEKDGIYADLYRANEVSMGPPMSVQTNGEVHPVEPSGST